METKTVPAQKAREAIGQLWEDARHGICTTITMRGHPVARVVPYDPPSPTMIKEFIKANPGFSLIYAPVIEEGK